MIERNFEFIVKVVQIDGGKEFYFVTSYIGCLGIMHRKTCPYTLLQNGVDETRIRWSLNVVWIFCYNLDSI